MNFGPVPAPGRFVIGVIDPRPGAMPVLSEDRLVGKLDAKADRKGGILQVHAIHEDVPFDPATKSAVRSEVEELAAWLGLDIAGL